MKIACLLTLATAMLALSSAKAEEPTSPIVLPMHKALGQGDEIVRIFPHGERNDRWIGGNFDSNLTIHLPESGKPTAAVVICPGGGYSGLAYIKEGEFVAKWMAQRGVAAGVLKYRVGGRRPLHPAPRDDVQLALQTMRSKAAELGYSRDKVGVMGFSAGGHLAATAATQYIAEGPVEETGAPAYYGSRPDFAILVYPVISMQHGITHGGSRRALLGDSPSDELVSEMSADERVSDQTPPTFLVHTAEDNTVRDENSLRFYHACRKHNVPVELHLFERGAHGVGMWIKDQPVEHWPELLERWMRQQNLIKD